MGQTPTRREIEQLLLGQRVAAIVWASHLSSDRLIIDAIELEDGTQLTFAPIRGCGPKGPQTVRMVVVEHVGVGEHDYPVELDPDTPEDECVLGEPSTRATFLEKTKWEDWEP